MTYTRLNEKVTTQDGWTVREFVDGTVEISKRFEKTINKSDWSQWGSIYYANVINAVAYPFTFAAAPNVRSEIYRTQGGDFLGTMHEYVYSTSSSPKVSVTRGAAATQALTVGVTFFATGKRASA